MFPIPAGQRQAPPGWHQHASRDPGRPWPAGSNVGIGCRASGIVVLDLDRKNGADGIATFAQLRAAARQPWPQTFTVQTPHNGLHLYFTAPASPPIASTIAQLGPGIDVRAPGNRLGGYVIGPGSIVNGRPYLISHDAPIIALPAWLIPLLRPATPRKCPHANAKDQNPCPTRDGKTLPLSASATTCATTTATPMAPR